MRSVEEIIALCARNAHAELSADDIVHGLAWAQDRLRTDVYHDMSTWPSHETAQRTFEEVTDVLVTCLDAVSERTEPKCFLTTAYCYHDLVQSGRELWWSVPSETGDEYVEWHGRRVRTKGRGPWLALAKSIADIAATGFSELPRTIPAIDRHLVYDAKTNQTWGVQSRTLEKCAIQASELPATLQAAFACYAETRHEAPDAILYVALPDDATELPTKKQAVKSLVEFGIPDDFAAEMAHTTFSGEIPVKLAMLEIEAPKLGPIPLRG